MEGPVTELYRSFFIDLGQLARQIHDWYPEARSILEIGCGEGALCQRLAGLYADAAITGIDITPKVGRLYKGEPGRVKFEQRTVQSLVQEQEQQYDLILICDVLHHVPWDQHADFLQSARKLLSPSGSLIVKDWERIPNLGHYMCLFSDRVLTGENVRFGTESEWRKQLVDNLGEGCISSVSRVSPWRNNILFRVQPQVSERSEGRAFFCQHSIK